MATASKQWKTTIIERLDKICSQDGTISRPMADKLIRGSAWWENHQTGAVRSAGDANNIIGTRGLWRIRYGANTFLISEAAARSCAHIRNWISQQNGNIPPGKWAELYRNLSRIIRGAVANYDGEEYDYYTGGSGYCILFGSHAIHIDGFIRIIGSQLKTRELYTFPGSREHPVKELRAAPKRTSPTVQQTRCPWCGAAVNPKNLKRHQEKRCPKRPNPEP